jgi:hypothetical protein
MRCRLHTRTSQSACRNTAGFLLHMQTVLYYAQCSAGVGHLLARSYFCTQHPTIWPDQAATQTRARCCTIDQCLLTHLHLMINNRPTPCPQVDTPTQAHLTHPHHWPKALLLVMRAAATGAWVTGTVCKKQGAAPDRRPAALGLHTDSIPYVLHMARSTHLPCTAPAPEPYHAAQSSMTLHPKQQAPNTQPLSKHQACFPQVQDGRVSQINQLLNYS